MIPKRINEIWHKIFFGGSLFEDFFFVFDDDFVISNFDDFFSRDNKFGIDERFDGGAFDDDLLDNEIF